MADLKISEMPDGGLVDVADELAVNRDGENFKVEVGSAAAYDVGTGIGAIPLVVDVGGVPGLPALDGSLLTNLTAISGAVDSVNNIPADSSGNVTITADDIDDSSTSNKFVSSAQITIINNTSGVNTGDQTTSGTTNRITVTNGNANPTIDISSSYVGQSSINTIGTITTGSWAANPIGDSYISSASTWNAKLDDITGFITAGTNISISGSGTSGSPYVINSTTPTLSLDDLTDVDITSATLGDILAFDGSEWTNSFVPVLNSVVDDFIGDGVEDTFTLSVTPPDKEHVFAFISGVAQHEFSLSGDDLTFDSPPANGLPIQIRIIYGAATGGGGGGSGTVTSVGITAPAAGITASGGPITTSGSITLALADDLAAIEALSGTGIATRTAANTWASRTVSGTTNRISITNGSGVSGNPTIDISSSYVGQSTITTLGTVTTGVWNGTAIGDSYISSAAAWNAKISNITGLVSAGTNISISGSGTSGSPYVINASGGGSGISGPGSSTDNAVARWDGTGGSAVQNSGVVIGDSNDISGFLSNHKDVSGTTYTLIAGDTGKVLNFTNSSNITVTLPQDLPRGFIVEVIQEGTGQITFSPASGASLVNRSSQNKTAGQYASVRLVVQRNSDSSSAVYNLAGDTA